MDNDAERKSMMSRPMPARPKGASGPTPPPPLEFRRQFMPEESADETVHKPSDGPDPFAAFAEIMEILKKFPKSKRRLIAMVIAGVIIDNQE